MMSFYKRNALEDIKKRGKCKGKVNPSRDGNVGRLRKKCEAANVRGNAQKSMNIHKVSIVEISVMLNIIGLGRVPLIKVQQVPPVYQYGVASKQLIQSVPSVLRFCAVRVGGRCGSSVGIGRVYWHPSICGETLVHLQHSTLCLCCCCFFSTIALCVHTVCFWTPPL